MTISTHSLSQLGWQTFFQQQLSLDEWEQSIPARIFNYERSEFVVLTENEALHLPVLPNMPPLTVGDWVLLDQDKQCQRRLDRLSLFSRRAAGTKVAEQLIAANVNTAFIVSSMNQDFNLNRIERYLALVKDADVEPVIVLTKMDCCDNSQDYIDSAQSLDSLLPVLGVNALDTDSTTQLLPWCEVGQTVTFLGSSGVGKSTLINSLMGELVQLTQEIREDDAKGRHTTTRRSLLIMPDGGLLLDTPGMRELQLADCEHGIEETFAEIHELASRCKFSDCLHQNEPGCAVQKAIADGVLDERRLSSYQKLSREQAFNSATLAEKRARDRNLGRYYRSVLTSKQKHRQDL
jgi:ribosome biogenesis GTPase